MGTLDLVAHSGMIGKLVLLILLAASVFSWTLIFSKSKALKHTQEQNSKFIETFSHAKNIDDLFLQSDQFPGSSVANVFKGGFRELKKVNHHDHDLVLENVTRSLNKSAMSEIAGLEKNISWLATTASASPFVGLFGTVWGIMDSFQGIGASGNASLAVVAPGISEALVATAAGIFVAVPAVVGYNHFANQIRKVGVDMEGFSQEFLNLIRRTLVSEKTGR